MILSAENHDNNFELFSSWTLLRTISALFLIFSLSLESVSINLFFRASNPLLF